MFSFGNYVPKALYSDSDSFVEMKDKLKTHFTLMTVVASRHVFLQITFEP